VISEWRRGQSKWEAESRKPGVGSGEWRVNGDPPSPPPSLKLRRVKKATS
jgi:hypothetical protein